MKRRTTFFIKSYVAIFLFLAAAYILTFQQQHWVNRFLTYNLSNNNDAFPTIERYAAMILPNLGLDKQESVPTQAGFRRFLMPVDGDVVADFNEKITPKDTEEYKLEGVILQAKTGANVLAGDEGEIFVVNYHPGIGWYVDINHGKGIFSRYANLAEIRVKKGETVRRGEIIGKVSKDHASKFYFQIFINGKAVNPVTATLMKKGI